MYEALLAYELMRRGCHVVRQRASTHPVFKRQLLTYLRALDLPLGLLVNFGGATMKEGLFRVVNRHDEAGSPLRMHQPVERNMKKWAKWLRRWRRPLPG